MNKSADIEIIGDGHSASEEILNSESLDSMSKELSESADTFKAEVLKIIKENESLLKKLS